MALWCGFTWSAWWLVLLSSKFALFSCVVFCDGSVFSWLVFCQSSWLGVGATVVLLSCVEVGLGGGGWLHFILTVVYVKGISGVGLDHQM
ncbi:hypothetical protein U1Q18_017506, partial [Sarracenia purpurea var. burkii]